MIKKLCDAYDWLYDLGFMTMKVFTIECIYVVPFIVISSVGVSIIGKVCKMTADDFEI